jgi:SlyX protein
MAGVPKPLYFEAAILGGFFCARTSMMRLLLLPGDAMSDDNRFIDIEIKLADQENLVDTLNRTVYEQGRRIDQLEAMVTKLAEHIRTLRDAGQGPLNERPPHY